MIKIVFPEIENPVVRKAVGKTEGVEIVGAENLEKACLAVRQGIAEAMIAGIDYTSREVILACRDLIGAKDKTFSASFVMTRGEEKYVLGDAAACKNPTEEQLYDIVCQTYETAKAVLEEPKVAVLSFSTLGSGGKDPSIERAQRVIQRVRKERPEILIDGEIQLDAAVDREVGEKKAPGSPVAGKANVFILPDLNSGNILYKAMERFGGFTAAGPILQGFRAPVSDLSRGSTAEDILAVIEVMKKLVKE